MTRDVRGGGAFVEVSLRSRLAQGARTVERDLRNIGTKITAIGGGITAGLAGTLTFPVSLASQAEETASKFNVVFGSMTDEMREFSRSQSQLLGVSNTTFEGMLSGLQDLLVPMGGAADESAGMSKALSSLAVDLGSFNNMRTSDVMRDLQAALTGSSETMKKYGVIVSAAAVNQELLNRGLDPKNVTEFQKAQARFAIIMRGTTAAQGDAVRTQDSFANSTKRLTASTRDLAEAIGGVLLDDLATFAQMATKAINATNGWVAANPEVISQLGKVAIAAGVAGGAITAIGVSALAVSQAMTVAGAVGGAFSSAMGVVSFAFGVTEAAVLTTSAALALMSGTATGSAAAIGLLSASEAANATVTGFLTTVYGLLSGQMGIAAAATTLFGGVFTSVSAAVAAGWALMSGPLLPFIAGGAALVGVFAAIGGVVAVAAVRAMDFGEAFRFVSSTVMGAIDLISELASVTMSAFQTGDLSLTVETLWASVQVGFWRGVRGALKSLAFFAVEGLKTMQRFFRELVAMTAHSMQVVARSIQNPFSAGGAIASLFASLSSPISFDVDLAIGKAEAKLDKLKKEIASRKKESKDVTSGGTPSDPGSVGTTPSEAVESIDEASTDAAKRRLETIKAEIIELEQGVDAAERYRLAQEGIAEEQIDQIMKEREKLDVLKAQTEEVERMGDRRVDAVFDRANQLDEQGLSAVEIRERVQRQIQSDFRAGRINEDQARDAFARNDDDFRNRIDRLKDAAAAIKESLLTPAEKLANEIKEIENLQGQGFITRGEAGEAIARRREEFAERQQRELDRARGSIATQGPTGTFSAFGATLIGAGPTSPELNELQKQTRELREIKRGGKVARFG